MHTYTHTGVSSLYCRRRTQSDTIPVTSKTYIHSVNRLWGPRGKELTVAYVWRPARKRGPQLHNPKKRNSANRNVILATQGSVTAQRGVVAWGGAGGRFKKEKTHAYLELNRIAVWQKPTEHCTAVILQLNKSELGSPELQQWAPKPPYENQV